MIWASGGILLWLGGWWFTGRLAEVYRKAIYLEEADRRHRGLPPRAPSEHHRGAFYFSLFDLGLLLMGIRSLATIEIGGGEAAGDESLIASVTEWSVLVCLYLFRQGMHLHRFYHARWRARTGETAIQPMRVGTLRGIWQETAPALRGAFFVAPILAAVPLALSWPSDLSRALDNFALSAGKLGPTILWFVLPQTVLAAALAAPLLRLRRRLYGTEA